MLTVMPQMVAEGYGRIVNVASIAGREGNPNAEGYSASKAGVITLTKSLVKEHAMQRHRGELRDPCRRQNGIFDQMSKENIGYMLEKKPPWTVSPALGSCGEDHLALHGRKLIHHRCGL